MARPLKKRSAGEILKIVQSIRGRNNKLWMRILSLAITAKPYVAKRMIRQIIENDKEVTKWMSRL